jgi:hypothetical protein
VAEILQAEAQAGRAGGGAPGGSPKLIQQINAKLKAGEEKRLRHNRRKGQYYLFIPMGSMASMSMEMLVQEDIDPIALASELGISLNRRGPPCPTKSSL